MPLNPVYSAGGHSSKANSVFNRPEILQYASLKTELEAIAPLIATAELVGDATKVGQTIVIMDEPDGIQWKPYETNQEMVPDQVTPTASCITINTQNYAAIKIDDDEESILGENFKPFYDRVLEKTAQQLAPIYDSFILGQQITKAAPTMRGNKAGRMGQVNLGSAGNPLILDEENIGSFFSQADGYGGEDRFMVLPPEVRTVLANSKFAQYAQVGETYGVFGTDYTPPQRFFGFDLIYSRAVEPIFDPSKNEVIYLVPMGVKRASAFSGSIVDARVVDMEDAFGKKMQFREVHGGDVIDPEALGLAVIKLSI